MSTMNEEPVLFEERATASGHRLGVARLNRPRQLNALTLQMCRLLLDQLRDWIADEGIVAVLVEGAGDKGFCAGGDVAEVIRHVRGGGPQRFVYGDAFFTVEYQLDHLMHSYPKPLIAYSHGVCMGGGVGLTVGARHRFVADRSRIAMPEIHIGLFPDVGGGWFLNRVPGAAGTVMALTGMIINEADALFAGLADYFVPLEARELLHERLLGLAWSGDAARDDEALTQLGLSLHRKFKAGLPTSNLLQYFDAIRFIGRQPTVVGVRDALLAAAEEDPFFRGPADNLAHGSPTAAFVTFEYLRRSRQLSLREVLELDLLLARQCQRRGDFAEGVRALLIDKDRKPAWSPARFEEVAGSEVAAFFEAPQRLS
ncbi:MAG: enoyl-CoA hydratase/isomerase family protein [Burkholderiaceae bacterium]